VSTLLYFIAAVEANDLKNESSALEALDSKWHICDKSDCVHRVDAAVLYSYICSI